MKHFPSAELTALALEKMATAIALQAMKSHGVVAPTLLISNELSCIKFVPNGLKDIAAKDMLAQTARLLAIANSATAVTTIFESWAHVAKMPGGPLTERLEVISIMTETQTGTRARILVIQRDGRGKFKRLRASGIPAPDSVEGRFTSLLPRHVPTPDDIRHARQLLCLMGISTDGKVILHHLN